LAIVVVIYSLVYHNLLAVVSLLRVIIAIDNCLSA
jgi:hypothetical protein